MKRNVDLKFHVKNAKHFDPFTYMKIREEVPTCVGYIVCETIYASNTNIFGSLQNSRNLAERRTWMVVWLGWTHWTNKNDSSYGLRLRHSNAPTTNSESFQLHCCTCFTLQSREKAEGWHRCILGVVRLSNFERFSFQAGEKSEVMSKANL